MQSHSFYLIVVLLVATVARQGVCKPASNEVKQKLEQPAEITKRGLEKFSIDFLKETSRIADPKLNLILSPLSIWTVLLLIFEGAKETTRSQISKTLGFPDNQIRHSYENISNELMTKSILTGVVFESVNGLIMDKNLPIEPSYSLAVQKTYHSNILPIDLANPEKASNEINQWVKINTRYRINELVRPDDLNLAKLVLANVIYFKGAWSIPFKKNETVPADFLDAHGKPNGRVHMMTERGPYQFSLVPKLEAQVVELPYDSSSLVMLVILPQVDITIDMVLEKLSTKVTIEDIFDQLQDDMDYYGEAEVIVSLPKFKIESDLTINVVLESMGIKDAFLPSKANLTGISKSESLFISRAMHKAEIVVNEEGTEASAITSSIFVNKSTTPHFKANKPFLFLIVEKMTKTIIFAGKFTNPPEFQETP